MTNAERRLELVEAMRVAPFISADESLRRCREGADEIERLAELAATWQKAAETWELFANRFANEMSEAIGKAAEAVGLEPPSQPTVN